MSGDWRDPDAAWWAKAGRARQHILDLGRQVLAFDPGSAYEVVPESRPDTGDGAHIIDLRLRVLRKPPTEMLTTIGDALHNMRSCLDSIAFELATRHTGGSMTDKQERAIQFPICETSDDFEEFLDDKRRQPLFGPVERKALRCVQPFSFSEEAAQHGVTWPTPAAVEYMFNPLHRLSQLNNLDKHRYLPLIAWHFEYAFLRGEQADLTLRTSREAPVSDGGIMGAATWSGTGPDPVARLTIKMGMTLADDPGGATGLLGALESWHGNLTGWIVPRIFLVAAGNEPPIMITA